MSCDVANTISIYLSIYQSIYLYIYLSNNSNASKDIASDLRQPLSCKITITTHVKRLNVYSNIMCYCEFYFVLLGKTSIIRRFTEGEWQQHPKSLV